MIAGFFMCLGAAAFVGAKLIGGAANRALRDDFNGQMKFNLARQQELTLAVCRGGKWSSEEINEKLGYKLDRSCDYDQIAAVRKLLEMEGFAYRNFDELTHSNSSGYYCFLNGMRRPSANNRMQYWNWYYSFWGRGKWRDEHPHGKEFPVSPYRYQTKERYFEVIDKEYEQAERIRIDREKLEKEWEGSLEKCRATLVRQLEETKRHFEVNKKIDEESERLGVKNRYSHLNAEYVKSAEERLRKFDEAHPDIAKAALSDS